VIGSGFILTPDLVIFSLCNRLIAYPLSGMYQKGIFLSVITYGKRCRPDDIPAAGLVKRNQI
jgi:hypothetical protein